MNKSAIKKIGQRIDYFKANALARRLTLIKKNKITLVFDVGAHIGEYAKGLRENGYRGRIVSFEPVSTSFTLLKKNSVRDKLWQAVNIALGSKNTEQTIHISGDTRASSLLKMLPAHKKIAAYFESIGAERITLKTLDSIFGSYAKPNDKVFLKIDAQGFENEILKGAKESLANIVGIQLEMSLVPLYEGETLLEDMIRALRQKGFNLTSLEYGFCDPKTGRMLQVDGIFFKG